MNANQTSGGLFYGKTKEKDPSDLQESRLRSG